MSEMQCIPVPSGRQLVRLPDGRVAGTIDGETFVKRVVGSKHRLRQPPAWSIQAEVYARIRHQVTSIVVLDAETGTEYRTSVETFDKHKGELDRGFGKQYYLTLNHWQVVSNGVHGRQLELWN